MRRAALAARLAALVFRWSIRLTNNLPAWLQGESQDTPCPAMYKQLPAPAASYELSATSFQLIAGSRKPEAWELEVGSCKLSIASCAEPVRLEPRRAAGA